MTASELDKRKHLLERQLADIQNQAEKILRGEDSSEAIESFARYSEELKKYIEDNFTEPELIKKVRQIEIIKYKRNRIKIWHIATLSFWIILLIHYTAKQKSIREIGRVKGEWSSFYMLFKTIM
jgi:hypothetical protein